MDVRYTYLAASAFRCMAFACCAASAADLRSASKAASTAAASLFAARALTCTHPYHASATSQLQHTHVLLRALSIM